MNIVITIDSKRTVKRMFILLLLVELLLVLLDGFINYGKWSSVIQFRRIFNVAREDGIATFFSALQLFATGLVVLAIYYRMRLENLRAWRRWVVLLLALFFLFMAFDDASKIHERVGSGVAALSSKSASTKGSRFVGDLLEAYPSYNWQIVFAPFFGLMGLIILIVLSTELKHRIVKMAAALGLLCYMSAVGIDYFEGIENSYVPIKEYFQARPYTVKHFLKVIEEFLEMFGTTLFLSAFLFHLLSSFKELKLHILSDSGQQGNSAVDRILFP
ncbi:hypothetical protein BVY02_01245 [bacterium J17]|nr:hypothetical protein BVY02_01245 [bacterium J17]